MCVYNDPNKGTADSSRSFEDRAIASLQPCDCISCLYVQGFLITAGVLLQFGCKSNAMNLLETQHKHKVF